LLGGDGARHYIDFTPKANERLEGGLVNFFSFVDVDRAAYLSIERRA
jgi:hypothetical protein